LKYHDKLQSEFDYNGYQLWAKPFAKIIEKEILPNDILANIAKDYAKAKAYRLGILKNITTKQIVIEKTWDSINKVFGCYHYARKILFSSKNTKEKTV
jgi:hypothetical protein